LLYQVATASLSSADIASPIRWILRKQKNLTVILSEVRTIDPKRRVLGLHDQELNYDYLILAAGMTHSYFGHNQWAKFAPGLKTLSEAIEIRRRILLAFETAEKCVNPLHTQAITTFVIIGGGPTGVEMAGAIAELTKVSIKEDFRNIDISQSRIILIEAGNKLLPAMPEKLSQNAKKSLEKLGVEVLLLSPVTDIQEDYVMIKDIKIQTRTVIWAAGVSASPLTEKFNKHLDRIGRIKVNEDLTVPEYENIFAIGDLACIKQKNGQLVPGMSPAAVQEGRLAAKNVMCKISHKKTAPFVYRDKGSMATIGKASAVASVGPFKFTGMFAWITWLTIHIFFLIGFRNRILVFVQWAWSYFTSQRYSRLITHPWRFWQPGLPDKQIPQTPGCHCKLADNCIICQAVYANIRHL